MRLGCYRGGCAGLTAHSLGVLVAIGLARPSCTPINGPISTCQLAKGISWVVQTWSEVNLNDHGLRCYPFSAVNRRY